MPPRVHTIARLVWWILAVVVIFVLPLIYLWVRDYSTWYHERKGRLVGITAEQVQGDSLSDRFWVTLRGSSDLTVRCGLRVPHTRHRRCPAIILLGGKQTGRYAIDYALDVRDAIIIAPDYPYDPRESYTTLQFLADVPTLRRALLDMVPSVMLITEYLWQREDVDTTKLILLGYSFGAPFVPTILSVERRPAAAAMVYGGGDLQSLIRHNVRRSEGRLASEFIAGLGAVLLRPLEPLRYADKVAPIPLVMINGDDDELIPRRNVLALYSSAREPKSLLWLPSKHVHPRNVELTRLIEHTLRGELSRLGIIER